MVLQIQKSHIKLILGMSKDRGFLNHFFPCQRRRPVAPSQCLAETRQSYQAPPPAQSAFSADTKIFSRNERLDIKSCKIAMRSWKTCFGMERTYLLIPHLNPVIPCFLPRHDAMPSVPHIWVEWKEASKRRNKIRSCRKNSSGSPFLAKSLWHLWQNASKWIKIHQNAQFDALQCGTIWYMEYSSKIRKSVLQILTQVLRRLKTSIPSLPSPTCLSAATEAASAAPGSSHETPKADPSGVQNPNALVKVL